MTILVATPHYLARFGAPESPQELNRFRSVVFIERGFRTAWSFGSGRDAKRVVPTGVFRTSDIEQMRMGVLETSGYCPGASMAFAAELREGTVIRLLTAFERTVQSLPYGLQPSPVTKVRILSGTLRRLSRSVPSSTRDPANLCAGMQGHLGQ